MRKVIAERIADIETQLKALENEHSTIRDLIESARVQVLDLAKTWQNAGPNEQRELQNSLFPEGLMWSHENDYFEPGNITLSQAVAELVDGLIKDGRARGFEPPTPWSRSNHRNAISLIRLAWLCVTDHGFTGFSAPN